MSGKIHQCPVDGCSYEGPKGSVQAHYSSKKDGLHPGGINKITELLSDSEQAEPEADTQTDTTEPEKQAESTPESTAGNNPTFGTADPVQEPEPDSQPSEQPSEQTDEQPDPDEYVCLDCGGELVDFRQHERGSYAEVSNGNILVRGEWLCSDCGKWWFDE